MNRVKAQAVFACLLIFSSFIVGVSIAQTPPAANTVQHGEGINFPTVTATDGYFYGPANITGRLFGDYAGLPLTGTTLDTGQGANELYDMNQNVLTTSAVTFATVNTGQGASEVYPQNQNLTTASNVQFYSVTANEYFLGPDNKTDVLAYPVTEASYIIEPDGANYIAKNGTTGQIDFSGATATTVINNAINSLTVGRTWKETVSLKGSFTITASIVAQDYLTLDLTGAELNLGFNGNLLNLNSKSYVDVIGGVFNGNKASYATDRWNGIADTGQYVLIFGSTFHDFHGKGVFARGTSIKVIDCISYDNNQDGIYVEEYATPSPGRLHQVSGNTVWGNGRNGIVVSASTDCIVEGNIILTSTLDGIHVEAGASSIVNRIIISNNVVNASTRHGIHTLSNPSAMYSLIIDSNIVSYSTNTGIQIYETTGKPLESCIVANNIIEKGSLHGLGVWNYAFNVVIDSNIIRENAGRGITLRGSYHTVTGNTIHDNADDGIFDDYYSYTTIQGNVIYNNDDGVQEGLGDYNRICDNILYNNTNNLVKTASNSYIYQNSGYVTENIGTSSILNGTTSIVIPHGLSYTPTSGNTAWTVAYLENPTNDPGSWYIDTFTATQATIHVLRDPGVSNLDISWSARRTP